MKCQSVIRQQRNLGSSDNRDGCSIIFFGAAPRPSIILLDLNLPGMDGRSVLHTIKAEPELQKIPVIVLTTSNAEQDVEQCYAAGANSYVQKPVDFEGFIRAIALLNVKWNSK